MNLVFLNGRGIGVRFQNIHRLRYIHRLRCKTQSDVEFVRVTWVRFCELQIDTQGVEKVGQEGQRLFDERSHQVNRFLDVFVVFQGGGVVDKV